MSGFRVGGAYKMGDVQCTHPPSTRGSSSNAACTEGKIPKTRPLNTHVRERASPRPRESCIFFPSRSPSPPLASNFLPSFLSLLSRRLSDSAFCCPSSRLCPPVSNDMQQLHDDISVSLFDFSQSTRSSPAHRKTMMCLMSVDRKGFRVRNVKAIFSGFFNSRYFFLKISREVVF